jgi:Amt family ammonium transporter
MGWLSTLRAEGERFVERGAIDFAGSGVVHVLGGFAAGMGAFMCGPRFAAFEEETGKAKLIAGHSPSLVGQGNERCHLLLCKCACAHVPCDGCKPTTTTTGTLVLFFGWFGFNGGSTLGMASDGGFLASKVIVNTALAASAGAITAVLMWRVITGIHDQTVMSNGLLGGALHLFSCFLLCICICLLDITLSGSILCRCLRSA